MRKLKDELNIYLDGPLAINRRLAICYHQPYIGKMGSIAALGSQDIFAHDANGPSGISVATLVTHRLDGVVKGGLVCVFVKMELEFGQSGKLNRYENVRNSLYIISYDTCETWHN